MQLPDQNPTRLRDLIHEGAEVEAKLAALEHEIAEAALTWRREGCPAPARVDDTNSYYILNQAITALIKFKAEEKIP